MSELPKKKCRFLNTSQGCRHGSRCRFSHAARDEPARNRRQPRSRHTARASPAGCQVPGTDVLQIPGYVYDPITKKYFKHDPSLQTKPTPSHLDPPIHNRKVCKVPHALVAMRCYRTVPSLQRHLRFAPRLQRSHHLQDTAVETYTSRVQRLQPFPNGDVGILTASTYRHTTTDDNGVYTAALQVMMNVDTRYDRHDGRT
jgi:hypothetical protein